MVVKMKRSDGSRWNDREEEGGELRSGVRARGPLPPLDDGPCASFEEVYRRFGGRVWSRIHYRLRGDRSEADDVQQQVFVRLARRIRAKGSVPHPVGPVLLGLVEDEVRNHLRSQKRRRSDGAPDSQIPASKPNQEQLLGLRQHGARIQEQVEGIFARMRGCDVDLIKLAHFRGLLPAEIAARIGLSAETVRARLCRARSRFAELYNRIPRSRREP
jgi:RNA polymerase sigma factor (sigma-70 family)